MIPPLTVLNDNILSHDVSLLHTQEGTRTTDLNHAGSLCFLPGAIRLSNLTSARMRQGLCGPHPYTPRAGVQPIAVLYFSNANLSFHCPLPSRF
jgi:hypothetical protein